MRTGPRRPRRAARLIGAATAVLAVLFTACDESPVGTEAYAPEPCTLPSTDVPAPAMAEVDPAAVRTAVLDAAERMTVVLPPGNATADLREALGTLSRDLNEADPDTGCRILDLARTALAEQEDVPATRPDRAALGVVVELATAALSNAAP